MRILLDLKLSVLSVCVKVASCTGLVLINWCQMFFLTSSVHFMPNWKIICTQWDPSPTVRYAHSSHNSPFCQSYSIMPHLWSSPTVKSLASPQRPPPQLLPSPLPLQLVGTAIGSCHVCLEHLLWLHRCLMHVSACVSTCGSVLTRMSELTFPHPSSYLSVHLSHCLLLCMKFIAMW